MSDQTKEERDREREDLEALILSPGWQRFIARATEEWGPEAYARKLEHAAAGVPATSDAESVAALTVLQITAARKQVRAVTNWPHERLKQLQGSR